MKSPAFSFYVRDWLCSKTVSKLHSKSGANREQIASNPLARCLNAYIFLLCEAWLEDPIATLPDNDDDLAILARVTPEEWVAMKPLVMVAFEKDTSGRWFNPRQMHEATKQANHKQAASKSRANHEQFVSKPPATLEIEIEIEIALRDRVSALMGRRPTTTWSDKELKALRVVAGLKTPPEDLDLLHAYYTTTLPPNKNFRRQDIVTLLNNWNGEIDRARKWRAESGSLFADPNATF